MDLTWKLIHRKSPCLAFIPPIVSSYSASYKGRCSSNVAFAKEDCFARDSTSKGIQHRTTAVEQELSISFPYFRHEQDVALENGTGIPGLRRSTHVGRAARILC